jgi:hypothetical protein
MPSRSRPRPRPWPTWSTWPKETRELPSRLWSWPWPWPAPRGAPS